MVGSERLQWLPGPHVEIASLLEAALVGWRPHHLMDIVVKNKALFSIFKTK